MGLRPKDWMLVQRRSLSELPDSYYKEAVEKRAGFFIENVYIEKTGYKRFDWGTSSLEYKDKSLQFEIPPPEFSYTGWDKIPIRVVMSSLSNTFGENQHFLYAYIPDKLPVCFYQFEAVAAEMTIEDIDGDGIPELIIGYKCGAHSEGVRFFKLDRNLSFYFVEGSDIGSDFPLITWGKSEDHRFFVNAYSRNWELDREKWHSRYERFVFSESKFALDSTTKVKWKNS